MLRAKIDRKRGTFLLATLLYILLVGYFWTDWLPAEDARIAFVYARNIAEGEGFVYHPLLGLVEGATPTLWVMILAVGYKIIPDIPLLSRLFSILSGIFLIWVVSGIAEQYVDYKSPIYIAPFVIAVTLTPVHTLVGFSTVLFGLLFALLLYLGLELLKDRNNRKLDFLFVFVGITLSITRPDGVFLVIPLLFILIIETDIKRTIINLFLPFGIILGSFHALRYLYFGYLFPNPFYVKSSGTLINFDSILNILYVFESFNIIFGLLAFSGILFVFDQKYNRKDVLFILSPLILYTIVYLFITQSQNEAWRFQYPYIISFSFLAPIGINKVSDIVKDNIDEIVSIGKPLVVIFILLFSITQPLMGLFILQEPTNGIVEKEVQIGNNLNRVDGNNTMVVDQAGAHAYHSNWIVIDALGLNNEHIAHNGYSNNYIDKFEPELIQIRTSDVSPLNCMYSGSETRYKMFDYSIKNDYTLAVVVPTDTGAYNWYFVRSSAEESDEIIEAIRRVNTKYTNIDSSFLNQSVCV